MSVKGRGCHKSLCGLFFLLNSFVIFLTNNEPILNAIVKDY